MLDLLGGEQDNNGCISAAGYTWCEHTSKCLRTWEESCEPESDTTKGITMFLFSLKICYLQKTRKSESQISRQS